MTRLTFEGVNVIPGWTRDSRRVVYQSTKAGPANLFWKPADGSGPEERLIESQYPQFPGSFTPDGLYYLYTEIQPNTGRDIFALEVNGERKARPFLQTPYNETTARLSPDGRWVAYVSDESGRTEVYIQPFPGPGGKYQISTDGGTEMVWGANGEIFYRSGNKMIAEEVHTDLTLNIGKPQVLFESSFLFNAGVGANYDVAPDGRRFLMLRGDEQEASATQINVVLNWLEELKQKVPTGK